MVETSPAEGIRRATLTCFGGYALIGDGVAVCRLSTGIWLQQLGTCVAHPSKFANDTEPNVVFFFFWGGGGKGCSFAIVRSDDDLLVLAYKTCLLTGL